MNPVILVNPMNEARREPAAPATRIDAIAGKRIGLLDISKPGGDVFLNRLETLLKERGATEILRFRKPTFAKPAPESVLAQIRAAAPDALVEALAD